MLKIIFIAVYRILMCLFIALPIVINYLVDGSIITSFIYIPLLCLFLTFIAIYLDEKIRNILNAISLIITTTNENKNIDLSNKREQHTKSVSSLY
ncbi:hypothetical protein ACM9HF_00340 [Colwellia sp. RE-S-Sl-9]